MTKLPGRCQPDLAAFPSLSLFGHLSPFYSNLILKPISSPPALVTSELCRDGLSVGVSDLTHPFLCQSKRCLRCCLPKLSSNCCYNHWCSCTLPLQPQKVQPQHHSLPIAQALVVLHQIQQFWKSFHTEERAEGFLQEAGVCQGLWAICGAAENCPVSPGAAQTRTRHEAGKCSSSRHCTLFPCCSVVNLTHFSAP